MSRIPIDDDEDRIDEQQQDDGTILEGEGTDNPGAAAAEPVNDYGNIRNPR